MAKKAALKIAGSIGPREALLATVAGTIAAGMVQAPSPSISTPSTLANAAIDIAELILLQAGIVPDDSPNAA
jgi:hypothetical protein